MKQNCLFISEHAQRLSNVIKILFEQLVRIEGKIGQKWLLSKPGVYHLKVIIMPSDILL